jgi:hypothetical protein
VVALLQGPAGSGRRSCGGLGVLGFCGWHDGRNVVRPPRLGNGCRGTAGGWPRGHGAFAVRPRLSSVLSCASGRPSICEGVRHIACVEGQEAGALLGMNRRDVIALGPGSPPDQVRGRPGHVPRVPAERSESRDLGAGPSGVYVRVSIYLQAFTLPVTRSLRDRVAATTRANRDHFGADLPQAGLRPKHSRRTILWRRISYH